VMPGSTFQSVVPAVWLLGLSFLSTHAVRDIQLSKEATSG
jgi:hypothetical protein